MPFRFKREPIRLPRLRRGVDRLVAVLVLNGARSSQVREHASLAATLGTRSLWIAVDGGLDACLRARQQPDLFVGDGDSVSTRKRESPEIRYDRDKCFSDFAGALAEARRAGAEVVVVVGATGGRLDHEWANLQEMGRAAQHFSALLAGGDRGTLIVTRRGCRVATRRGRTFSLLPIGARANVTLRGSRWELSRANLRAGSQGLSNLAQGPLRLTVHQGGVVLMFPLRVD